MSSVASVAPVAPVAPALVAVSHGTRVAAGRRAIAQLRLAVGALRPGLEVVAAHVDVQKPALDDVVARLTARGRSCVVVPLLLSTGYHVRSDVAGAVRASGGLALAAAALGPDEVLVEVLADRLAEVGAGDRSGGAGGWSDGDAVLLAAAGSLSPRAAADVAEVVAAFGRRLPGTPVLAGYASAQRPTVPEAAAALRAAHPRRRVVVAPYLLAPGVFSGRLDALLDAGAVDAVAAPLGADARVAALALRRYDAVAGTVEGRGAAVPVGSLSPG